MNPVVPFWYNPNFPLISNHPNFRVYEIKELHYLVSVHHAMFVWTWNYRFISMVCSNTQIRLEVSSWTTKRKREHKIGNYSLDPKAYVTVCTYPMSCSLYHYRVHFIVASKSLILGDCQSHDSRTSHDSWISEMKFA